MASHPAHRNRRSRTAFGPAVIGWGLVSTGSLTGETTMPADRGLFLDLTWRLHPEICAFTSEVYYDDRLRSVAGLEQQRDAIDRAMKRADAFEGMMAKLDAEMRRHENQSRTLQAVSST